MAQARMIAPRFEKVLVADKLKDGYWIQAVDINGDGKPDLITSGLAIGEVYWYEKRAPEFGRPLPYVTRAVALNSRRDREALPERLSSSPVCQRSWLQ